MSLHKSGAFAAFDICLAGTLCIVSPDYFSAGEIRNMHSRRAITDLFAVHLGVDVASIVSAS